jgi:predicted 3-demethylubiquinone-9 3-methyltransferase (glyoxalase superfamily)
MYKSPGGFLQVRRAPRTGRPPHRAAHRGGEVGPCGWVKDRFGLSWQFVPEELIELIGDKNPLRANAAVQAMLGMTKIDIQALRDAADAAAPA